LLDVAGKLIEAFLEFVPLSPLIFFLFQLRVYSLPFFFSESFSFSTLRS